MKLSRVGSLAAVLIAGCASWRPVSPPATLASFLPQNGEIEGYSREGESSFGQGLTGLTPILDGGAEAYVKLGALAGVFQDYASEPEPTARITVTIYQAKDAGKLYREIYPGRSQVLPGIGQEARRRLDIFGATELDFYQGPFYAELVITGAKPQALDRLRQFAEVISRRQNATP